MPALQTRRPEPVPAGALDAAISILTPYVTRPGDVHQAAEAVTAALHLVYEMHLQHLRERLHDEMERNKDLVRSSSRAHKELERYRDDARYHRDINIELSQEARRLHEEMQRTVYRLDEQRAQTRMWKDRAKRAERREVV